MKPYINNKNPLEKKFSTLKLALVLGLGLFLLIFPKLVFSASPFQDDFEGYDLGNLTGQGNWEAFTYGPWRVQGNKSMSGSLSIDCQGGWCGNIKTGSEVASGVWIFYIWIDEFKDLGFLLLEEETQLTNIGIDSSTGKIKIYDGDWNTTTQQVIFSEWKPLEIEWSEPTQKIRFKYADEDWSIWYDPIENFSVVDGLFIVSTEAVGNRFIDFIGSEFKGVCGSGNSCIFCSNQTDCEGASCYWIEMPFPFVSNCIATSSPIETATGTQFDFDIYYATNSQFSTPTAFITGIAEATQPFLVILSSWLENFSDLFDLSIAQEKGQQLGNAIPRARGYLDFFNSLFYDLPLSEILLVYLVILIGLIIFRIVRQIKKLFAF